MKWKKSYRPRVRVRGNSDSKKKIKAKKIKFCLKTLKIVSIKIFWKEAYALRRRLSKNNSSFKV